MAIDLDKKATQAAFAKLAGISQQAVSKLIDKGILVKGQTLREWLLFYCDRLREEAAGRAGADQVSLTQARTREAIASAILKEQQVHEKAGTLIPAEEIEPELSAMVTAMRTELLTLPDKITMAIKTMYDIDVDPALIQDPVYESLEHLAKRDKPVNG